MAKKLIVANWKMHFTTGEASLFLHKLQEKIPNHNDTEVVLCPNMLCLQSLYTQVDRRKFRLGAQNCYHRDEGAYTGEVSATMMRGLVDYIIVGHSERRHVFGETDKTIALKVQAVIRNGIRPILCVGETANERADGETKHVLHGQVIAGFANVTSEEAEKVVVAYEPVWAIGSGKNATPDDAAIAIQQIRKDITALFGDAVGQKVRVLYGGSVDNTNAGAFLVTKGIDGLLVGGSSLNVNQFASIVSRAHDVQVVG